MLVSPTQLDMFGMTHRFEMPLLYLFIYFLLKCVLFMYRHPYLVSREA